MPLSINELKTLLKPKSVTVVTAKPVSIEPVLEPYDPDDKKRKKGRPLERNKVGHSLTDDPEVVKDRTAQEQKALDSGIVFHPVGRCDIDWDLFAALVKDSPLKSAATKASLAEDFVTSKAIVRTLRRRLAKGGITSDEVRAMNGAISQLTRICKELGVTKPMEDTTDDFSF